MSSTLDEVGCVGPVVGIAALGLLIMWCSGTCTPDKPTEPEPEPPAAPTLIERDLIVNFLSDNQIKVQVKNEGEAGWVEIAIIWYKTKQSMERGESGVEKSIRETFTREKAPPDQMKETRYFADRWTRKEWFEKDEEKTLTIDLPRHSSLSSGYLWVEVSGLLDPSPGDALEDE